MYQIIISGQVQGVGFRPFIYNLATQLALKGYVTNNEFGVKIILQENKKVAFSFYNEIKKNHPKSAKINSIKLIPTFEEKEIFESFFIKSTEKNIHIDLPLTPDFSICENCKKEITNPKNRRYFYPFTTCTTCGPRYAITHKFPFERENTSLKEFKMCTTCKKEYTNPKDIRFHSQTNSCPDCGIKISFTDNLKNKFEGTNKEIFTFLSEKLNEGKIVAVKNTSGYLFLCDATNARAIQELRNRKKRLKKPFAVLFPNKKKTDEYLFCDEFEETQLNSTEAPIVILKPKLNTNLALDEIAPNLKTIGAMLPYTGVLHLISHLFNKPLVATSGNIHNSPICKSQEEATHLLNSIADYFLHHNLQIEHPQDDSVIKITSKNKKKIIFRRSRGLAPNFGLDFSENKSKKILCLGADLKNTITLLPNNQCYVSEYIGNLENYSSYNRFEEKIKKYQSIFDFKPEVIISDGHPNYENNKIIKDLIAENEVEIVKVQHHKAHYSAILGEKNLWKKTKILGVIWDGMGFGNNNEILGGEFFSYKQNEINLIANFGNFSWILGDKMSKIPKISALSISENDTYFENFFDKNELKYYSKQIENSKIKTSSVGRLFDAVAFVLGFKNPISFEGEAGIYVENLAQTAFDKNKIEFEDYLKDEKITIQVPTKKLLLKIVEDVKKDIDLGIMALNFHYTLVKCIEKIATFSKSKKIAFSGGVFQNSVLIDLIIDNLQTKFELYFHENISPNDENISFGQLNYYLHLKE